MFTVRRCIVSFWWFAPIYWYELPQASYVVLSAPTGEERPEFKGGVLKSPALEYG